MSIQTGIQLQDQFSSVLYGIIDSVNIALGAVYDMQRAMSADIDTSSLDAARDNISQTTAALMELNNAMEAPAIRQPAVSQTQAQPLPAGWNSYEGLEVFQGTGMERYEREISEVNVLMERLGETQGRLTQQANESEILSPQASYDIQQVENRVQGLMEQIRQVESSPLNIGTDQANAQYERLRAQMNEILGLQGNLGQAMQGMDISEINEAYLRLSQNVSNTERMVRDSFSNLPPAEVPVSWNTDRLQVFTGTGIERFRQEVQGTNAMLERLGSTQAGISAQAARMNILPPAAVQDINGLTGRIDSVRERIQQIENNPVNLGTDMANAELEQLRGQLSQMIQQQDDLNRAMQDMDASAANEAYLRLSRTVGETEQYIRDNVDEQGRFNQQIRDGTSQAENLMRTIGRAAAAYLSIQSVKNVLNISDNLTQNTARLNLMNEAFQEMGAGFGSTDEMINTVYASAQNARGSFGEMAAIIARFGNNAKDAFGSSAEVVDFANLIQKQMVIAGANTQESANAMLQLSQALGSGVLRGDELRSIFEQAPNLIRNIADYMDVPIGQIRDMASEGQITADIIKSAVFAASDDINSKFEQMPMTWGQVWQSMQNTALMTFQPVLERLNQIANSEGFQNFVNGAMQALAMLADAVLNIFDLIGAAGGFITDNWSWISPIIYGVAAALGAYIVALGIYNTVKAISSGLEAAHAAWIAMTTVAEGAETTTTFMATAAQYGFNAALMACPLTWIILLIIALIAIIYAVCSAIAKLTGVASSGFGIICGCINVVNMFFKNLAMVGWNVALAIGNAIAALANNMMAAFNNAICSIQSWFYNLLSTACSVIAGICAELNKLPFVEFDYSGMASAADEYAAKAEKAAGNKREYTSVSDAFNKGWNTFDAFQDGWIQDAFNEGASWGDGLLDKVKDFFNGDDRPAGEEYMPEMQQAQPYVDTGGGAGDNGIANGIDGSNAAGNIADIKDSMDITQEDLKYLRDLAEQETVNRFTIAEIKIDQSGMKNTINGSNDLDGFVSGLTDAVNEAVENITEGVHN